MNKLILISNNLSDIEKVKRFANKNRYSLECYSKEEWKNLSAKSTKKSLKKKSATTNPSFSIIKMPVQDHSGQTLNDIKASAIKTALLRSRGNATKAAKILQIGRATLYRKLSELEINPESLRNNIAETEYQPPLKKTA